MWVEQGLPLIHTHVTQQNSMGVIIIPSMCRHQAGLPTGKPEMPGMIKLGEIKYMYKYFTYLCPSKLSSCTIKSIPAVITSTTLFLRLGSSIFRNHVKPNVGLVMHVGAHLQF